LNIQPFFSDFGEESISKTGHSKLNKFCADGILFDLHNSFDIDDHMDRKMYIVEGKVDVPLLLNIQYIFQDRDARKKEFQCI
jgi:hypothetical protein